MRKEWFAKNAIVLRPDEGQTKEDFVQELLQDEHFMFKKEWKASTGDAYFTEKTFEEVLARLGDLDGFSLQGDEYAEAE